MARRSQSRRVERANRGIANPHPELDARTAYDDKELHDRLSGSTDDELKQIPLLPSGSRLEQGATYINLRDRRPREFTARGDMEAGPADRLVLKSSVGYDVWNRLTSEQQPAR